jgi:hypothetical protein
MIPHVIVDDFLNDFNIISNLATELFPLAKEGSHHGKPYIGLKRKEIYLHHYPEETQTLGGMFSYNFWNPKNREYFDSLPAPFNLLNNTTQGSLLLGYYDEDDTYSKHHDDGFLTALLFLHRTKDFKGGELVVTNQKRYHNYLPYGEIEVEPIPNRLIIFPSCYIHSVNKITESRTHRIALSYFLNFKV